MTEEFNDDRITQGFVVGTILGTIFSSPVNYSAYIYGFNYSNPVSAGTLISGSVGSNNVQGVVVTVTTSRFGTITGTVDVVELTEGVPNVRGAFSTRPVARVEAGDQLTAVVINSAAFGTVSASVMGVVGYKWIPGRLSGP